MQDDSSKRPSSTRLSGDAEYNTLKRTVLLYSSAVIATLLLKEDNESVSIFGFDVQAHLLILMRYLIWISSIYYVIGYVLSLLSLRRTNSAALEGGIEAERMFKYAEEQLWSLNGALERITSKWAQGPNLIQLDTLRDIYGSALQYPAISSGIAEVLISNAVLEKSALVNYKNKDGVEITNEHRTYVVKWESVDVDIVARRMTDNIEIPLTNAISMKLDELDRKLIALDSTLPIWRDLRKRINEYLPRFSKDIRSIARTISLEQKIQLYVWDLAGVSVAFLVASLCTIFPTESGNVMLLISKLLA